MAWTVLLAPLFRIWDWIQSKRRKREDEEWATKHTTALSALCRALPRTLKEGPSGFDALIPDRAVRNRIEFYLIEASSSYSSQKVKARTLSAELLRTPVVRQTIQDVLDSVETLKRENPDAAQRLL